MAFDNKDLSVLAYASGFTYWYYKTNDVISDVKSNDYFPKGAIDMMACGDLIIINASDTTDTLYIKSLAPMKLEKQGV